jgi:Xaa-Pro aminopeptidase
MDYFALRRERLIRQLAEEGVDALMVSNPVNVTYLTGFTGDSTVLLLCCDNLLLVSDSRYTDQLAEECPGLPVHIRSAKQKLPEAVVEALKGFGIRSVGFESSAVTVAEFELFGQLAPQLDWKGGADRVERLRMVKDASELAQIRTAIDVAERAFTAFRSLLHPEDTEKDLCDALEHYARRAGGSGTAFPPIVAVGERAALPHAPPTNRTVASGELLLVDWGVSAPLYKSDLTRVLINRNNATFNCTASATTAKLYEVYSVVLQAQEAALRTVRPGVSTSAIDAAARAVIAEAGYGEFFGHGLGHGFGLQIHEAPWLRPNSDTPVQPGMVFTLEPGIYLPGWGGVRIEDDVLVTPDGVERLTHLPRDWEAMLLHALGA